MSLRALIPQPILPVIVIDDARQAVPLAEAFLAGGLRQLEVTFRTAAAADAIRAIRTALPEMLIGAGTLLTPDQARAAIDAGAQYGLAPGLDEAIVKLFADARVPYMPGVMTPTEIGRAAQLGCRSIKFFPAENAGGAPALKSMLAPFKAYNLEICPTGGISLQNMRTYLAIPEVITVGGSWLATQKMIAESNWALITRTTQEALAAAAA
jgi:2-dehydro-3-deoxyphosphogluconate aldolase/(4S)-4-hydroxy-2-oxoglutarate aldolase